MFNFVSFITESIVAYENDRFESDGICKFYTAWTLCTKIKRYYTKEVYPVEEYQRRNILFNKWATSKEGTRDYNHFHMMLLNQISRDMNMIYEVLGMIRDSEVNMIKEEFYDLQKYRGYIATEIMEH